ncbi:LacI family DNA-binding transcriptional regulator [Streptomyces umbrinus]|uniref:LacI family DNA-binding transcriptional regulator n=1 Tax=Streptomyces umbrinus TaxID=67370 RepID=UPI0035948E45
MGLLGTTGTVGEHMRSSHVWQRPTLGAVAARAGVSTATVSNALNGTGRLSEPTRQRMLSATRELGYAVAGTVVRSQHSGCFRPEGPSRHQSVRASA